MSRAARFAAVYAALTASHELADHWVQTDHQSVRKGLHGPEGRTACLRHVASYTATQALALAALRRLDPGLTPTRITAALAISAVTHYVADRQGGRWRDPNPRGVARLAHTIGKTGWLTRDPHAPYLMDQSWHKAWIAVAAAVAAAGRP
ncbi:hypothetical protein GCM10027160_23810 [Streptomyces calidiresistens]|uniref:DUF3307 domain-containing protein n=1 Tax=Streptomyces calidiresistens TaxID=1485586 RepID=A0A7W3XY22_9ACTN|nr:hypothetical protein [Streptomyces calidiresistens]MBB0231366.1 hypothetical protein [Streptomyces calidiresistens]